MRMACTQTRQNVGITICRRQFVYNLPFSLLSSRPRPWPQLPMSPMLTLQACVSHTPKNRYPHQCQCLVLAQKTLGYNYFLHSMPQCVFWPSKHCVYYDYDEARVVIIATVSWGTAKQFTIAIAIGSWKGPTGYEMHPHPAEPNGTASTSTYEHSPHEDVVCCMFACMHGMRICCWIIGDEGNRTPDLLYAKQTFCHWTTSPENLELCWPRFRS